MEVLVQLKCFLFGSEYKKMQLQFHFSAILVANFKVNYMLAHKAFGKIMLIVMVYSNSKMWFQSSLNSNDKFQFSTRNLVSNFELDIAIHISSSKITFLREIIIIVDISRPSILPTSTCPDAETDKSELKNRVGGKKENRVFVRISSPSNSWPQKEVVGWGKIFKDIDHVIE